MRACLLHGPLPARPALAAGFILSNANAASSGEEDNNSTGLLPAMPADTVAPGAKRAASTGKAIPPSFVAIQLEDAHALLDPVGFASGPSS